MKKRLLSVLGIGLLTSSLAFADSRVIVVSGSAEKSMDPNMVTMTVEVWSKAATAKQAQGLAAQQFSQVKKTLNGFKVKPEDMQTDNYALNPDYEYDQKTRQNKLVGYRVSQSMMVTLRKVDDAGPVLDALVVAKKANDSGVNINNIGWDSDKRAQAEVATLADAVKSARTKAEEIAKAAGVRLKGVSRISHTTGTQRNPQPEFRNFAMKAMADAAPTELAAGQVKVHVEVTAEYEIH